ncbi:ABC transporter ATP-binding protein/permease [Methylococcus sp. EFPC2]|uniref:ABC transporter ATP-binding protein/permease n=1 Tax=Methylococcus sp. EFPC2 TaxID=2812648 RepID=UPI00196824FD|nr:SbmA/BacA-like family transporter [Methylococcus sp. EFPC2]QSA97829.1 ABC transporter ATP-binding protein/permease [Methylococcus sp. EFPC2]
MNANDTSDVRLDRRAWERFQRHVSLLVRSEEGGKALTLFALLIAFLFGINGLNVVNSYVGRDFMTAIAERDRAGFIQYALVWIGVFAAITVVSVISRYAEERMALLWRVFLAQRTVHRYTGNRLYFHMLERPDIGNPDQRISEDIKAFTTSTLSFALMLINSSFTVVAFSGVLWSISPLLLLVAVIYAALGSYFTIRLGRPLMRLNFDQLDKEANFRSSLIYLRENADAVALTGREGPLTRKLLQRLDELAENLRTLIGINRNVGFFTTFYNWLIQIIPALFVAPLFIAGEVEFGVITQSAMAFTALLGAFSLIVTQFQSISSFAAVLARLSSFGEVIDEEGARRVSPIAISEEVDRVAYAGLTLRSPRSGRILVENLTLAIPHGLRTLVTGEDETSRTALFRATAGIWDEGEGTVIRPGLGKILFVTEKPYLHPGTLRDLFFPPESQGGTPPAGVSPKGVPGQEILPQSDARIVAALSALGLESLPARFGGLDAEHDWDDILPLGEQQLLVFARLLFVQPRFAFLDRPATALEDDQLDPVLRRLTESSISYVVFAEAESRSDRYDAKLELGCDGQWRWQAPDVGQSP